MFIFCVNDLKKGNSIGRYTAHKIDDIFFWMWKEGVPHNQGFDTAMTVKDNQDDIVWKDKKSKKEFRLFWTKDATEIHDV
ncbi:MAG: hypothetical protein LBM13_02295 [Candidatus Ancillula sp.]|jgi:hypothetical protein|nr:hypothetical protein [Candidatus Ancillula sp.]